MKHMLTKFRSNTLAVSSLVVFAGSMTANIASYVYHLLLGRLLGPHGYGEISSLFSILYIFTVPLLVVQTVLIKYFSEFKAKNEPGRAKTMVAKLTRLFVIGSAAGLVLAYIGSPFISGFLHLSSNTLFILVYILFVFSLLSILPLSALQGFQLFFWFSIFSGGTVVAKLILSIPMARWGVSGVLAAAVISAVAVYVLYYFPLAFLKSIKGSPVNLDKKKALLYLIPTLLTLLGTTSIYSTDIILVRHFLSATDAGMYAAIAILGKIIFFASSSISMVTFPVLSEQSAKGSVSRKIIFMAIAGVAAVSALLASLYIIFPDFIVRMLFGTAYSNAAGALGLFGIFIALFSVGNIVSMMCLAIGKTKVWVIPFFTAFIQAAAIIMYHDSVTQIIMINIIVSGIFSVGALGFLYKNIHAEI